MFLKSALGLKATAWLNKLLVSIHTAFSLKYSRRRLAKSFLLEVAVIE
jgi:hypothetical protein